MHISLTYNLQNGIKVSKKTKIHLENINFLNELNELLCIYHDMINIIPQTRDNFASGHSFPYQDSWDELQISFNLCSLGYYKQANTSLRSALELGLLSVYWNINNNGESTIKQWFNSKENTPRLSEIWKCISKNKNFQVFQLEYNIKERLLKLNDLHNFVHTKGYFYSNKVGLIKSNTNTFEEEAFTQWYKRFKEVVLVIVILHLVKYPLGTIRYDFSKKFGIDIPWFGVLEIYQVDRLEKYIGSEIFNKIYKLSENDKNVQQVMNIVINKPDMTEQDMDNQIMKKDKADIKYLGFKIWVNNEKKLLNVISDKKKFKNHIEYLENWATQNGYIECESIRLCNQIKLLKENGKNIEEISNIINECKETVKIYYNNLDNIINNLYKSK